MSFRVPLRISSCWRWNILWVVLMVTAAALTTTSRLPCWFGCWAFSVDHALSWKSRASHPRRHHRYLIPSTTRLGVSLSPEQEALQRTQLQLQRLRQQQKPRRSSSNNNNQDDDDDDDDDDVDDDIHNDVMEYLRWPANTIKVELKRRGLPTRGRKPDLARRLAEYEFQQRTGRASPSSMIQEMAAAKTTAAEAAAAAATALPTTTATASKKEDQPVAASSTSSTTTSTTTAASLAPMVSSFCGISLSETAGRALGQAGFEMPTPVQQQGIPLMVQGNSVLLHAETGSGKTLAYLLPITETLWREVQAGTTRDAPPIDWRSGFGQGDHDDNQEDLSYALILTPTRELAAQVAGVASVLAPPGTVRLVSHPTNLASDQQYWKERQGGSDFDAKTAQDESYHLGRTSPRIFVGSAKAIMHSLYGDGKMPASPTRKPAAQALLKRTRWVVLDEVDRLLLGTGSGGGRGRGGNSSSSSSSSKKRGTGNGGKYDHQHEKPAAILTSAVARRTLGRAQVVAASATMGRTLKREVARVLGLGPKEWPQVVQGNDSDDEERDGKDDEIKETSPSGHVNRAVTIPNTVQNYILPVDTSSFGKLLTNAFFVLKALNKDIHDDDNGNNKSNSRILLVLTKSCGMSTTNAVGALRHFGCRNPEPQSLLDVLQAADGTDQLMEIHRQVSKSSGVGMSANDSTYFRRKRDIEEQENDAATEDNTGEGYLLVTGEDTVRGLHLDGLDTVVVVGRAPGPDEYMHIAGRTGRAGKRGKVINVLSESHATAIKGWERMLDTHFEVLEGMDDVAALKG